MLKLDWGLKNLQTTEKFPDHTRTNHLQKVRTYKQYHDVFIIIITFDYFPHHFPYQHHDQTKYSVMIHYFHITAQYY